MAVDHVKLLRSCGEWTACSHTSCSSPGRRAQFARWAPQLFCPASKARLVVWPTIFVASPFVSKESRPGLLRLVHPLSSLYAHMPDGFSGYKDFCCTRGSDWRVFSPARRTVIASFCYPYVLSSPCCNATGDRPCFIHSFVKAFFSMRRYDRYRDRSWNGWIGRQLTVPAIFFWSRD